MKYEISRMKLVGAQCACSLQSFRWHLSSSFSSEMTWLTSTKRTTENRRNEQKKINFALVTWSRPKGIVYFWMSRWQSTNKKFWLPAASNFNCNLFELSSRSSVCVFVWVCAWCRAIMQKWWDLQICCAQ